MKSRRIAAILLLGMCSSITLMAQDSGDSDAQRLEKLEQVWNQAHESGDAAALDKLWASDMEIDVPRMSAMSKGDVLAYVRSGHMKFSRYTTSNIRVRVYGESAVVTGRLQRTRTMNGKETNDDWRFTKVYVKQGQQWRVVSFHASEAAL